MSAPRKSRKPRLWISGTRGASKEWNPTKEDWRRFESAYGMARGQHFDDGLRSKIHTAVTYYFYWEPYESAPFADDLDSKLLKAKRLADDLAKAVCSFGEAREIVVPHWQMYFPPEREVEESHHKAPGSDSARFEHIVAMPTRRGCDHSDFEEVVHTIGSALDSALAEVRERKSSGWREGEEWKKLVKRLARSFISSGLASGARKDPNYQESPFVRFFRTLQSTFDEEFRRHEEKRAPEEELRQDEVNSGLSRAISQVLKSKGKTRKKGANLTRRKEGKLPQKPRKRL